MESRRNFLKLAGVGITGSLLKPVSSTAAKLKVGNNSVKIGVLLPQSNEHPLYPGSFLNGLRLGLNQGKALKKKKIELITENVKYGSPLIVKEKTQQLITENSVNLLIGLLNPEVATDIGDMVRNAQIPTLIANAGENYLMDSVKENPYLFFNSLNLFQNSYLAGKYAVEKYGENISVVTSLYDSGYDALFAFYKGLESAGGNLVETYLKKQNDNNFIHKTIDKIEKGNVDGLYVYLNGNLADEFFRTIHHRNLNVPMLTTSFAAEDNRLVNLGAAANKVQSFKPWTKNLRNKENRIFVQGYQKQYSKEPDQFSFLGYESGLVIYDALLKCKGDFSGSALTNSMKQIKIISPGGLITFNKKSGLINNPVYFCRARPTAFSISENEVVEAFTPVSEFDKTFATLETEIKSGWLNPYLFV